MANSNNWGEIYKSTWWGDEDWSANSLKIDSAPPGFAFTGLLDTYTGAAAAYSVRKLSSTYTGGALRVRRSSDDTEQDIGFDGEGNLDTTALTTFVNADVVKADTDFSSGFADTGESGLTRLANQSIGGRSGVLKGTIQATTEEHRLVVSAVDTGGKTHRLQTSIYIPSGQSGQTVDGFRIENGGFQVYATTTTKDAWVDIDVTWTSVTNANVFIKFLPSGGAENWTGNGTDEVYIGDITITQTTADGAVTKWYDQSGNNHDAINADASAQPLVVSGGSVVTENDKAAIDFDGVDDYLTLGGTNDAGMLGDISVFSVNKNLGSSASVVISTGLTGSSTASVMQWSLTGNTSNRYRGTTSDGTTRINEDVTASNYGSQVLVSMINDESGNLQLFADGVGSTGQTAVAPMYDANYDLEVGRDTFRAAYNFSGTQQELILYASDQSSNRTGIETNINDHFDIYAP